VPINAKYKIREIVMQFLDGPAAQKRLVSLINQSSAMRIAVAFWGQPAPETLGLLASQKAPQIVCNLKMGGTNPDAIMALQDAGVNVLQSDQLHAKVYLFDTEAIVGSSNASANGLSLQDDEIGGWHEANISVSETSALAAISDWFDKLPKRKIKPSDLVAAKELWSRRRRVGLVKIPPSKSTLIDDLRNYPKLFRGRRLFVCTYSEDLSSEGEKALKFARKEANSEDSENIEGYEWPDMPVFADLLCFWKEGDRFTCDGIVHSPETRHEIAKFGTKLQVCHKIKAIAGYPRNRVGKASAWMPALRKFMQDSDDPDSRFLDMGEFAEKYLGS
jgi:hypothetical protein